MSSQYVTKRITCDSDHGYAVCPGHEVEVRFHYTSMTFTVSVDGDENWIGDSNLWKALMDIGKDERAFHTI